MYEIISNEAAADGEGMTAFPGVELQPPPPLLSLVVRLPMRSTVTPCRNGTISDLNGEAT